MAWRGPNPSIVMTSPPVESKALVHPRRIPAHRSVSLLHSNRPQLSQAKSGSASSNDSIDVKADEDSRQSTTTNSPSSLQPLGGKDSSGESSNAEKWFEKSNNDVRDNSASFVDNDPPFFMRNSSSSETPPDVLQQQQAAAFLDDHTNSLPLRTGLLQLGTDGSSTEDFRGVIDDLTVQNKKLKRRLKKYEKLHDAHLKNDKLFEVRIHGLPAEKKRELEETLRKFASSLGRSEADAFPAGGYASLLPTMKAPKTTSSQASLHNADSAYASMSASGQGSVAQSGNEKNQQLTPTQHMAARRQNIHSYLHHIPEGLLPQQIPSTMSDRARKKLVVRKLEQVFAGRGATAGGHQQSLQQEEVSQTAARNDRSAMEAAGERSRQEGSREAKIMDGETEDPLDLRKGQEKQPSCKRASEDLSTGIKVSDHQTSNERSPNHAGSEQRPTRPLDLDPQRAQVPVDNIRYMRRLGFSPPDPESSASPEDGHGWIYLNFLINMAQLHTINVTTDFVRKSLSEYSDKFEVSDDGRKVRWKGGESLTRTSSNNGGGSSNDRVSDELAEGQSPRKKRKLTNKEDPRSKLTARFAVGPNSQRLQSESSRHVYTPMFSHKDTSDDADDSSSEGEDESVSSPVNAPVAGDSSGMTSSIVRTSSGLLQRLSQKKKQKRDDGPIIFYNNARFCTDLSGDRDPNASYKGPTYTPATIFPIGKTQKKATSSFEKRGPLAEASLLPEPMHLSDNPIPASMELTFPQSSPPRSQSTPEKEPMNFDATGIGGVWPTDNFSISVESRQVRLPEQQELDISGEVAPKSVPSSFAKTLRVSESKPSKRASIANEVVATRVKHLAPSELPPALDFMGDSSPGDDETEEDEDEMSDEPESPADFPPSAAPQPADMMYASSEEEEDEDDDDDDDDDDEDSDDGEVDFLAAARQADPEAVREKEREYDANMAERLAEEIPMGSSAATAGGGSGFASPASGVHKEEYRRAMRDACARPPALQPARDSDSMVVHMKDDSSDSGAEDEEMSDIRS